ncbi:hypothetical protein MTO96_006328 [Rhipicephalus appendiculatus]
MGSVVDNASDGRRRVYLAVAATYFGNIGTGLTYGYSSPALNDIRRTLDIGEEDAAWFGSLLFAGGIVGGVCSQVICALMNAFLLIHPTGQLLNLIGRRGSTVAAAALFAAGWLLLAFANSKGLLFSGRFLTGAGLAVVSAASSVFVAEVAPTSLRGTLNTGCNFIQALGVFLGYVMGKWLNYQWLAAASLVPAVINGIAFSLYVRESPLWLLQKGRRKEAMEALQFYRGSHIENEFKAMESSVTDVSSRLALGDLMQPYVYKSFLCALLALLMQQLSVVNILLFFAQDIFREAGVAMAPDDCAIIVGGIQALFFLVAALLAGKAGLKLLFVFSTVLCAASLIALGLCFHLKDVNGQSFLDNYGWLSTGKTLDEIEQIFGKKVVPTELYSMDEVATCHL